MPVLCDNARTRLHHMRLFWVSIGREWIVLLFLVCVPWAFPHLQAGTSLCISLYLSEHGMISAGKRNTKKYMKYKYFVSWNFQRKFPIWRIIVYNIESIHCSNCFIYHFINQTIYRMQNFFDTCFAIICIVLGRKENRKTGKSYSTNGPYFHLAFNLFRICS